MHFSVQDLLDWTGGRVINSAALGSKQQEISVEKVASLKVSGSSDVAFFFSRAFEAELPFARPGILIVGEPFAKPLQESGIPLWNSTAIIACHDPYFAMALVSEKFAAVLSGGAHFPSGSSLEAPRIHPSAIVHETAEVSAGVQMGAHCVLEAHAKMGQGSVLYPGCYVGKGVTLGAGCVLFPGVTLYEGTVLGDRVRLHAGTVVGADGFGYAPVVREKKPVGHQKIYHLGIVVIGDDVEVGANCTIDRATFGETRIERNAKLDNLVHVGHNASVGEGAIICGGTCLAGNASVGRYSYIGGLTGIANHVHVGDGAKVGALTMVTKDVAAQGTAVGNPQREYREHFRAHALLSKGLAERRKR